MNSRTTMATVLLSMALTPALAATSSSNMDRYVELLRSDVKADKTAVLTEALQLTDAEGKVFWPIYREYDVELSKLGDARYQLLKQYAKAYEMGTVQDSVASDLATRWFKLQQERLDLLNRYYKKIAKAVSPMRAAQFVQAENQIGLLIDVAVASETPFIEKSEKTTK